MESEVRDGRSRPNKIAADTDRGPGVTHILAEKLSGTAPSAIMSEQSVVRTRTLKTSIGCSGIGLHSGAKVTMVLHPAASGTGIRFRRVDISGGGAIVPALWSSVHDTR
jgi:UDP-3-O-[3-hydroxymyristoyl] N-acetylglucosamine deacetylase